MADVSERRIRPIEEAVEIGNWKQALQLSEKWHKRGEKSDRFQAVRAFVLAKQLDAASAKRGRNEIVQLCNRTPAITDRETIYQIQVALNDLRIEDDGGKRLWERAAAAKPDDKDLALTWLDDAIERGDWQSAQKATMVLRKSSPKDRNLEFWTIFMCFMIYNDRSIPDKERTMFGTLAYRMLSKAAEAITQDPQSLLSAGKAIQSPEELLLLVRIYSDTGHIQEAKELLLTSKTLGPESALFKLDGGLHTSLQLEVLEASQDCVAIVDQLRRATKNPPTEVVEISRMVRILFDVEEQSGDSKLLCQIRECLESGLDIYPDSRDLLYGMMRLAQKERAKEICTDADLLKAGERYFANRCKQLSCFEGLRNAVQALDSKSQQQFIRYAQEEALSQPAPSIIPYVNALKLEYCFLISPDPSTTAAQAFPSKAMHKYRELCQADGKLNEPSAQLAMLASMALLQANQAGRGQPEDGERQCIRYLQAAFLLRYCLTKTKDDYPSLIVLTLLLQSLGAMSFSATCFKKLGIKNLQWENAGHVLFTRISTLHPQTSNSSEEAFDPLKMLDLALLANANSIRSVGRHVMTGLNCKSYTNVMDTIQLKQDLKNSFSRHMYEMESRRIKSVRNLLNSEREPLSSGSLVDGRDFTFIPSFEHPGGRSLVALLQPGGKPGTTWLQVMGICDAISNLLYHEHFEVQPVRESGMQDVAAGLNELHDVLATNPAELTDTELDNSKLCFDIGRASMLRVQGISHPTSSAGQTNEGEFEAALQRIQSWLQSTATRISSLQQVLSQASLLPPIPSWQYLHTVHSALTSLSLISLFLAVASHGPAPLPRSASKNAKASGKGKAKNQSKTEGSCTVTSAQRAELMDLTAQVEDVIHGSAREMKERLGRPGVLGGLVDAVLGRCEADAAGTGDSTVAVDDGVNYLSVTFGKELETLPDVEGVVEGFCADVRESWVEGLDGILQRKIRRFR